jgi:hypothetical protein
VLHSLVRQRPSKFSVACAENVTEVVVLFMVPGGGSEVGWVWAIQFDAGKVGRHRGNDDPRALKEVVMC